MIAADLPVRPPSSVKRCYGTPNCSVGGTPGVGSRYAGFGCGLRQNSNGRLGRLRLFDSQRWRRFCDEY